MSDTIKLDIQLRAFIRRETQNRWVAVCPQIDVVTQGTSQDDAKRCIHEAVQLWFDSCIERGTLPEALRECGFRVATGEEAEAVPDRILVSRESEHDVLGDLFDIHVTIPAYEAAPHLANA